MQKKTLVITIAVVLVLAVLLVSTGTLDITGKSGYHVRTKFVCEDSDESLVEDRVVMDSSHMVEGYVKYSKNYGKANITLEDECTDETHLREQYCTEEHKAEYALTKECVNGCENNACLAV